MIQLHKGKLTYLTTDQTFWVDFPFWKNTHELSCFGCSSRKMYQLTKILPVTDNNIANLMNFGIHLKSAHESYFLNMMMKHINVTLSV